MAVTCRACGLQAQAPDVCEHCGNPLRASVHVAAPEALPPPSVPLDDREIPIPVLPVVRKPLARQWDEDARPPSPVPAPKGKGAWTWVLVVGGALLVVV